MTKTKHCFFGALGLGLVGLAGCKAATKSRVESSREPLQTGNPPLQPLNDADLQNPNFANAAPQAIANEHDGNGVDGPAAFRRFSFAAPASSSGNYGGTELKLWATYYYIPKVVAAPELEVVLRDSSEKNLLQNEKISKKDWCDLALQGSGRIIKSNGQKLTVSFNSRSAADPIFCHGFIGVASIIEKVKGNRFSLVDSVFGRGARVQEVIPYRTIAVDPTYISYGSLVYIPAARGQAVSFESGAQEMHDGYFFAGDTGSAIIGNHIDVFTGTVKKQPFTFVRSEPSATFRAYVVRNEEIRRTLAELHEFED